MRSIVDKTDSVKQAKRNRGLLIFMLLILVFSSLGYSFLSNPNVEPANNQVQQNAEGKWLENVQGQALPFTYSRNQVSDIPVNVSLKLFDYYQKDIYVVSDNYPSIYTEFYNNFALYTGKIQEACLGSCEKDLPEKTCQDLIIIWDSNSNNEQVYQKDKCVYIEGGIESVDAFLYSVL